MPDEELRNAELAIRCQLGDQDAWDELVRFWHPKLWQFVSRMLSDQGTVDDVLQTVWLRVVRSLFRLREPRRLAPWMYRVARLAVVDQLRQQYRRPTPDELGEISTSDDGIALLDTADAINTGLTQLHPIDREAIVLFYFEQRSVNEIAVICGVPVGTTKSRLHRARAILRTFLTNEEKTHVPK